MTAGHFASGAKFWHKIKKQFARISLSEAEKNSTRQRLQTCLSHLGAAKRINFTPLGAHPDVSECVHNGWIMTLDVSDGVRAKFQPLPAQIPPIDYFCAACIILDECVKISSDSGFIEKDLGGKLRRLMTSVTAVCGRVGEKERERERRIHFE